MDAALPHQSALLVSNHRADWDTAAQNIGRGLAIVIGRIQYLGQKNLGHIQKGQHLRRPVLAFQIKQQGARGIGRIRRMDRAARQTPNDPTVHRPCQKLACRCPLACTRYGIKHPSNLGPGKIGIEQKAGNLRHLRLMACLSQGVTD